MHRGTGRSGIRNVSLIITNSSSRSRAGSIALFLVVLSSTLSRYTATSSSRRMEASSSAVWLVTALSVGLQTRVAGAPGLSTQWVNVFACYPGLMAVLLAVSARAVWQPPLPHPHVWLGE
jgi:hypothetical protein